MLIHVITTKTVDHMLRCRPLLLNYDQMILALSEAMAIRFRNPAI